MQLNELLSDKSWLMEPTRCLAFNKRLASVLEWPDPERMAQFRDMAATKALRRSAGGIAVMPIHGLIEQRLTEMSYFYGGGFSTEDGSKTLGQLLAAKDVATIVLHVDSPGGTSYGVEEFAQRIYDGRQVKPIHTVFDSMGCSAAYWLGSAASSLTVTPGGDVGSIGVYSMHVDWSKAYEAAGIKVTFIQAGKYKTELSPSSPLSDEAFQYQQEMVNTTYDHFVRDVARNRGVTPSEVKKAYGQGRVVPADAAKEAGMVDRIASFDEVLGRLSGDVAQARGRAALLKAKHESRKRALSWAN